MGETKFPRYLLERSLKSTVAFASYFMIVSLVSQVRLIIAAVMAPPNIFLAFIVSRNFGFLEFRIVGASEFLQSK